VETRLRDLPGGDLPLRKEHERFHPAAAAVRRQRGGGVPGGRTGERADAKFLGDSDADGHPAVLERAGGVHPLVFDPERLDADRLLDSGNGVQRGAALGERHAQIERERLAVAPDAAIGALGGGARAEVVERRRVVIAYFEQTVTLVAGVPDCLGGRTSRRTRCRRATSRRRRSRAPPESGRRWRDPLRRRPCRRGLRRAVGTDVAVDEKRGRLPTAQSTMISELPLSSSSGPEPSRS